MDKSLTFTNSILESQQSQIDVKAWDNVMDAWEAGNHREAVIQSLNYLGADLVSKYGDETKSKFTIPHGSVIVNVEITDTDLIVGAPFLNVSGAAKVPLYRQVAQINFSPLNLTEIILKDDELRFHFQCPLDLCEPYKLYDAWREICINADRYDDQFIKDFGATWIQEPKINKYTEEQYNTIDGNVRALINEALEYVNYFEGKRLYGFAWDTLNVTIKRIDYVASPQGNFRNEIEEVIGFMERQGNMMDQIAEAKKFLGNLSAMSKEDLMEDVYDVDVFVPYKYRGSLDNVKQNLQSNYERAGGERGKGDHMGASLTMLYAFYNLFYSYNISDEVANGINAGLKQASGANWGQSSDALWTTMDAVMRDLPFPAFAGGNGASGTSQPKEKKKGFLSGLFGG